MISWRRTPFQNNDINGPCKVLEGFNYQKHGDEVMYSGINGAQLKTSIFIGPTYYQRLKIMVYLTKCMVVVFVRQILSYLMVSFLTKQPAAGRANNGGLRIGEMEKRLEKRY